MHLPVVTVRTPLQEERRSVRLGHRRPKPVKFAAADIRRQVEAFSAVAPAYVEEEHCT